MKSQKFYALSELLGDVIILECQLEEVIFLEFVLDMSKGIFKRDSERKVKGRECFLGIVQSEKSRILKN